MSDDKPSVVRTEDGVGPYRDKHAMIVNNFREVHAGAKAEACSTCRETKDLASKGEK